MSIFDRIEKELCEQEKEQAEIEASNEYQKEQDEENSIVITVGELKEIIKDLVTGENCDYFIELIKVIKFKKGGSQK